MKKDFAALIAQIKLEAQALERSLVEVTESGMEPKEAPREIPSRGLRFYLAELPTQERLNAVYQVALGRSVDPQGLEAYGGALSRGMPPLLLVGILMSSTEGRSRAYVAPGFAVYRYLAFAYRVFKKFGLECLVFGTARLFTVFHSYADLKNYFAGQAASFESWWLRQEARLRELEQRASSRVRAAETRLFFVEEDFKQLGLQQQALAARLNALALNRSDPDPAQVNRQSKPESESQGVDLESYYLAFEDAHRGTEEQIQAKLRAYLLEVEKLKLIAAGREFLDLGCGRGEWLAFLSMQGLQAWGVDSNKFMVSTCQARGLQVVQSDLLQALQEPAENSLAGVSAFHVAEHLPFAVLLACVQYSWAKIAPGGLLIMETPNPENVLVGSHTFYHDHTHRNPLTPSAMEFLLRYVGFQNVYIKRLNPYPDSARVPGEDLLTERFNGHFCGPQDYAVIGQK